MALLSGRHGTVIENRERAISRRKFRLKLAERKREEGLKRRVAEEIWAEHQAILDRIEQERYNPKPRPAPTPRVRGL